MIVLCLAWIGRPAAAQTPRVSAEQWFGAGTFMLTVEVGGAAFTDFDRTEARPVGEGIELEAFHRRISARTAGSVGAWMSYWIGNGWGVRAGASYVPSSFTVWNDESAQRALDGIAPEREEPSFASLGIWMAHASAVFRFPRSFGRVVPYGILGGGVIRYKASDDAPVPPEARARFADGEWQTEAAVFGIGAAIPLQRRDLLMTFELTNHLARTPLSGRSEPETFDMAGIPMQLIEADASGDDGVGMTSHLRLALGLTLPLR